MTRLVAVLITAAGLAACERPAPSTDAFGNEEPVQGVHLGMQAGEYLSLHAPEDRRPVGYEDRVGDSLYYRFRFDPGGASGAPTPPDTAVLASVERYQLVEDDTAWREAVRSLRERFGPPTVCVRVQGLRIEGRWAEWRESPGLSAGYVEEVRADPRAIGAMVREHRVEIALGRTTRPTGPAYPASEIECPTGQSAIASST